MNLFLFVLIEKDLHLTNTENVTDSSPSSLLIFIVYFDSSSSLTFLIIKPTIPVDVSTSFVYLGPSKHSRIPLYHVTVGNGLPSTIASMKSFEPSTITLLSGFSI